MRSPSRARVAGPLAEHAEGFAAELGRLGYARSSAGAQLRLMAQVSGWLALHGLDGSALASAAVTEKIFAGRRAAGHAEHVTLLSLAPLLGYLRRVGATPAAPPPPTPSPLEALLGRYRDYLTVERGLRPATAARYAGLVRPFLAGRLCDGGAGLEDLAAGDVSAFVVSRCRQAGRVSAKTLVTALRSLLRFLHVEGAVGRPLAAAVPSVAGWKLAGLPRGLDGGQVAALLAAPCADAAVWARDLAILTLLARLGLRVGEVAALRLDDIDWHRGELVVCGKGDRRERLPLPADVGQALATYLQHVRPREGAGRAVFVTARAPRRGLTPGAVTQVVVRAARRAGLGWVTGHRLRHSAAGAMLRSGASLAEIGDVLRHRHAQTTAIYAKVDYEALRTLARPWPAGAA